MQRVCSCKKLNSPPLQNVHNCVVNNLTQCIYCPTSTQNVLNKPLFKHCQCNYNHERIPSVNETTIQIKVKGHLVWGLVDTGADSSVVTRALVESCLPEWRNLPTVSGAPQYANVAGGGEINILATKIVEIEIAGVRQNVEFHIIEGSGPMLLGLNLLKIFKISIFLETTGVTIYCGKNKISNPGKKDKCFFMQIPDKISLHPKQTSYLNLMDTHIEDNKLYMVHSYFGPSIVVPTLTRGENTSITVFAFNDNRKKAIIKKGEIVLRIEELDTTLKTHSLTEENLDGPQPQHFPHFYTYNRAFYCPPPPPPHSIILVTCWTENPLKIWLTGP